MTTVVIVDDDREVRNLLTRYAANCDLRVVGATGDGEEAISLITHQRPSLVLLDLLLPGLSGIEVQRRIQQQELGTATIAITAHARSEYIHGMLEHGAMGYVSKTLLHQEFTPAVRAVLAGSYYLSPSIFRYVLEDYLELHRVRQAAASLSPRDRQLLAAVAAGKSSEQIANELRLSVRTVEHERQRLKQDLGLASTADMIKFAIVCGYTSPLPHFER